MRRLSGARIGVDTALLARMADALALLVWMRSRDGERGVNRPRSVLDTLLGADEHTKPRGYAGAAEFAAAWASLAGGDT